MKLLTQLRRQATFDLLIFRRNPAATFFTVAFPLIFLFVFVGIFGNDTLPNGTRVANFYVAGILALSIISASMVNIAMTMTSRRERGMLKRVRGTPLRPWVFVAAQGLAALTISVFMTVLMITIGHLAFDVSLRPNSIVSLILTVLVGTTSFNAIGLALTVIIPSESAAPAITNAIVLPLYFISDVFIVDSDKPALLATVAKLFPIQHLSSALFESFDPTASEPPWPWTAWLVILGWGLTAAIVTIRYFRWVPRRSS